MNPKRASELRERLILTESRFEQTMEVKNDPIDLVSRYKDPRDQEVAALIAAVFSYGNVKQIQSTLDHVFTMLGPSPASTIKKATGADWKREIPKHFKHRFNTADDLGLLLTWLGHALRKNGSLKDFFYLGFEEIKTPIDIGPVLESFVIRLTAMDSSPYKKPKSKGALFFFPKPSAKSACKRLLLFLRWVAGNGPMDLSLWKDFPLNLLLIPVDTHVLRISRHLGLTRRKDNSWKTATEITSNLKFLDASDPTRFDFALCHMGISKECPSRYDREICQKCLMNDLCLTYAKKVTRK